MLRVEFLLLTDYGLVLDTTRERQTETYRRDREPDLAYNREDLPRSYVWHRRTEKPFRLSAM